MDFDPRRIAPEAMLAALKKAGEEATLRPASSAPPATADPRPQDAARALLAAFDRFAVVALVDPGALEEEHDLIVSLIRTPDFGSRVSDVVVDFGNALHQQTLDRYVAGAEVSSADLKPLLRDSLYSPFGAWEAPVYARLLAEVRNANRGLPPGKRLRVIVTGAPIDWTKIQSDADHDRFCESYGPDQPHLAAAIEKEVLAKGRKALVVARRQRLLRRQRENDLARIEKTRPGSILVVAPHLGFEEWNAELEPRLESWSVPSLAYLKGTWLGDQPDDEFSLAEVADAYLYLGPRALLKVSQPNPEVYRDDAYFAELARRYQLQSGPGAEPFDRAAFLKERPRRFIDTGH